MSISPTAFFWSAYIIILVSIVLDFVMTMRVHPQLWMKLIVTHLLDMFVQYSLLTSFGFVVFKLMVSVV
jgi:hypothetical protein